MSADVFYICPECGSPSMSIPVLGTSDYECGMCSWKGIDPIMVPVDNPFGTKGNLFEKFAMDLLTIIAKEAAIPMGRALIKWGFVRMDKQNKPSRDDLARYLKAAAGGAITAVLKERQNIEASL